MRRPRLEAQSVNAELRVSLSCSTNLIVLVMCALLAVGDAEDLPFGVPMGRCQATFSKVCDESDGGSC